MELLHLSGDINDMNCYLVESGGACYVVDPGYEKEKVVARVRDRGLAVLGILLTHAHIDHMGALDAFDAPVHLHALEVPLLRDVQRNGSRFFGKHLPFDLSSIELRELADGALLPLGGGAVLVLHTPGHTAGGVCYRFEDDLFTGDTLFRSAVGRWNFPTGSLEELRRSVVGLVDGHGDDVRVLPGHGPSSTIGVERRTNPYYLDWKA